MQACTILYTKHCSAQSKNKVSLALTFKKNIQKGFSELELQKTFISVKVTRPIVEELHNMMFRVNLVGRQDNFSNYLYSIIAT